MSYDIKITKVEKSKVSEFDFDNIPLGRAFTDHMFVCEYANGQWNNPRIEPLKQISMHPATMALHYGQAIFEGMKATLDINGNAMLFRPEKNAHRLNFSADRLGMPRFPEELFVEGLKKLVDIDRSWIPTQKSSALYLRPFMYADEPFIGMRAATHYKFIIIASPSGPIYNKRIKLYAETEYVRAVKGGTGEAKAAGNYAAAILPTEIAKSKGYDQVLWLDAHEFKYIQEAGTMNVFFRINDEFITPSLDGAILNGISRLSTIELLRDKGYKVTERLVSMDEIIEASNNGTLQEAFGCGTAVGVAMIEEIGYRNQTIHVSKDNPVGKMVMETIVGLRAATIEDKYGWIVSV
ncbi:branched-chain-amino-acid aminotransferase 2 [Yeosuana aromativorans]|uniref:Branched-chain-amino-acid aminotransferase n=1 Tax=Yeosuana aromativorans TaxID=288019 RepID=A0A8J3BGT6_9FLAO|nr:branched-chain amino acid aminotransferase [Yeosuana aromativorans]GGK09999.1 branched-chain-amino-acid aminotransferase 2 [Yeosuana aromativorans]